MPTVLSAQPAAVHILADVPMPSANPAANLLLNMVQFELV